MVPKVKLAAFLILIYGSGARARPGPRSQECDSYNDIAASAQWIRYQIWGLGAAIPHVGPPLRNRVSPLFLSQHLAVLVPKLLVSAEAATLTATARQPVSAEAAMPMARLPVIGPAAPAGAAAASDASPSGLG